MTTDVTPIRKNTAVIEYDLDGYEGITPLEAEFVVEYLISGNETKAYSLAFGVPMTADTTKQARSLLKKKDIKNALAKQYRAKVNNRLATDETIISNMIDAALFDVKDLYDQDGRIKNIQDLPSSITRNIKAIAVKDIFEKDGRSSVKTGEIVNITFVDKVKATETLLKQRNLLKNETKPNHLTQINIYDSKIDSLSAETREELVKKALIIDPTDAVGSRELDPYDFSDAIDTDYTEIVYDDSK